MDKFTNFLTGVGILLGTIFNKIAGLPKLLLYTVGAFICGTLLGGCVRGCLAVAIVVLLSGAAYCADPCAIGGTACGCGCQAGGACNCTLLVSEPATGAVDPQRAAYDKLVRSLKPGDLFQVFVNTSRQAYVPWVRWDGYPGVTGQWCITGRIGEDGNPYEYSRVDLNPRPATSYFSDRYASFFGGRSCSTCR